MRILYVSHLYHPEPGAQPVRVSQLSQRLAEKGHDVTVLTGVPNHPNGEIYPGHGLKALRLTYTEWDGPVRVVRVAYGFRPNRGAINRLVAFSTFAIAAGIRSLAMGPYDVVVGTIPQPLAPLAAWFRSFCGRARFVLEVRDLWPEGILATGQSDPNSFTYRGVDSVVKFLYQRADRFIAVTEGIRESLIEQRGIARSRIDVVRAGVDPASLLPTETRSAARSRMGVADRFVVTYSGTVGNAHGLETLLDAARILGGEDPSVLFMIVGSGAEEESVRERAGEMGLTNVRVTGQLPRRELPSIYAASDLGVAVLRPSDVFRTVVPTKIYEYMAAGLPVLANIAGETERILNESSAGVTVPMGDGAAIARAIGLLTSNPGKMSDMAEAGRTYVSHHASWSKRADEFEQSLVAVVES